MPEQTVNNTKAEEVSLRLMRLLQVSPDPSQRELAEQMGLQHAGDLPNAVVLLFEAGDRHAIFGLQLLVSSGACVHQLTLTDQVLHFRFESATRCSP